jgi:hypothetical protein
MTKQIAVAEVKAALWRLENNLPVIWDKLQEAVDYLCLIETPLWFWS